MAPRKSMQREDGSNPRQSEGGHSRESANSVTWMVNPDSLKEPGSAELPSELQWTYLFNPFSVLQVRHSKNQTAQCMLRLFPVSCIGAPHALQRLQRMHVRQYSCTPPPSLMPSLSPCGPLCTGERAGATDGLVFLCFWLLSTPGC